MGSVDLWPPGPCDSPRLAGLWARLIPGLHAPATVREAVEVICGRFTGDGGIPHTAIPAVLWVIWESRNAMIFQAKREDVHALARHIQQHIELWTCRDPRKLDMEPLKLWCQTVIDVN